jgi:hypothetical protein
MEIIKNKKKFRRLIIGFYLLCFLILFAVLVRGITETSAAWYNSSWLYRRPVTITGNGNAYSNLNVLVNVDTSALISASKLQSDCDDIRFTDTNETTLIDYWIEGGCGTTSTQIWVKVPSMPTGNKVIYMYYGNTSASNAELSWTGNFYLFSDETSCGTGWTSDTNFNSRYVYGSTSANTVKYGTHLHYANGLIDFGTPISGTVGISFEPAWDYCGPNEALPDHAHEWEVELEDSSLPPYYNVLVCYSNKLDLDNKIAVFDNTVPSNWTRVSILDGRFLRGYPSAVGGTGGSFSHTHSTVNLYFTDIFFYGGAPPGDLECGASGITTEYSNTHSHSIGTVSASTVSLYPPYIYVIFGKSNGPQSPSAGMIAGSTSSPPLGWSVNTALDDDRILMGSTTFGSTGGTSTHTHTVSGQTGAVINSIAGNSMGGIDFDVPTPSHTHPISSTTTSSASSWPDSRSLIFVQRNSSLVTLVGAEEIGNLPPSAPTSLLTEGLTNPTNVLDLTPEFSAIFNDPDSGDNGIKYQIQVNTGSGFTGTTIWDSGVQTMTATPVGSSSPGISYGSTGTSQSLILNGATYYWRIKFWDEANAESPWSAIASFKMNAPPNQPTNLLTEGTTNPTSVQDLTPEFSAIFSDPDSTDTGEYYDLQVNTASNFSGTNMWYVTGVSISSIPNGSRSSDISYGGTPLSRDGSTYYWRIRFKDRLAGMVSPWSATASFTMNNTPTAPTSLLTEGVSYPQNVTDFTPEFSAIFNDPDTSDTGEYYQIEVNTNSSFTGTEMWDSTKTGMTSCSEGFRCSNISYAGTTLSANGAFLYWRIKYWDNKGAESPWSSYKYFRMQRRPSPPTNLLTDGNANPVNIYTLTPKFSAVYIDVNNHNATAYEIEVNSNNTFTGTIMWDTGKVPTTVTEGTRSPDYTYAGTTLSNSGNTYYWRIRFWDADDLTGDWSSTATFVDSTNHQLFEGIQMEGIQIN